MPVTYTITRRDLRAFSTAAGAVNFTVRVGARGDDGEGVPTGGTTAQRLKKLSNTDFDTGWAGPPEFGGSVNSPTAGRTYYVTGWGLFGTLSLTKLRVVVHDGGSVVDVTVKRNGTAVPGWDAVIGEGGVPYYEYPPDTSPLVLTGGDVLSVTVNGVTGSPPAFSFGFSE